MSDDFEGRPGPVGNVVERAEIERRLPHAGAMCLVDRVDAWSANSIACRAAAPGADHPLAASPHVPTDAPPATAASIDAPTLHAVATVEYAAQAVALHASLVDEATSPRAGMLAKLSEVNLSSRAVQGDLVIQAWLVARSDAGCMYSFDVHDAHGACSSGRLMIAFTP